MADEPTTIVAPEGEAPESPAEPRVFTEDDLRDMDVEDFLRIHPKADSHIDSKLSDMTQREMLRLLPGKEAEIREMVTQENEQRYLDHIQNTRSRIDYLEAKDEIEKARAERGQKTLARSEVEQARLDRRKEKEVQPLADKVYAVAPEAVDALNKKTWAPGDEGIEAYLEALHEVWADAKVSSKRELLTGTAVKEALADVQPESPDVGGTRTAQGRTRETWAWYEQQPLETRLAIKKDTARYDAITKTIGQKK